ncbi:MAG: hypothetical protein NTZ35_02460 [Ignavibacteriales bacterium]|nr:hypothetical protein [Ignavibacteriales bacterium]
MSPADWGTKTAAHLLRRTTFGPTRAEIVQAASQTLDATLTSLMAAHPAPDAPIGPSPPLVAGQNDVAQVTTLPSRHPEDRRPERAKRVEGFVDSKDLTKRVAAQSSSWVPFLLLGTKGLKPDHSKPRATLWAFLLWSRTLSEGISRASPIFCELPN